MAQEIIPYPNPVQHADTPYQLFMDQLARESNTVAPTALVSGISVDINNATRFDDCREVQVRLSLLTNKSATKLLGSRWKNMDEFIDNFCGVSLTDNPADLVG